MKPHLSEPLFYPRKVGCGLSLLLMLAAAPREAAAATVVSNLSNATNTANTIGVIDSNGVEAANAFTTGTTAFTLDCVTLSMLYDFGTGGGGFTVSLYSSITGLPGADLGVTFTGNDNPGPEGLYAYTASVFTLAASTTYWLVATVPQTAPNKTYRWAGTENLAETGDPGWGIDASASRGVFNGVRDPWFSGGPSPSLKFSVQATVVPEPSSALLLLGGWGALVLRRRP